MGKTSIVVRDVPGFATSRLGVVLGNEAIRMLADGVASAKDIDTAMVLGYKHPMGLGLDRPRGARCSPDILLNLQRSFNDDAYAPHRCCTLWPRDGSARKQERDLRLVERAAKKLTSVGFETNIKYGRGEF